MTIASLIKKKQKQLKLSTYQLAKKLRISFVALQRVLTVSSQPNVRTLGKYAKFLGLSVQALERKLAPAKRRTGATKGRSITRRRRAAA